MQVKTDHYTTGVCVGRFQTPELHQAHVDLLQTLIDSHERVIVFLGISPASPSFTNPLPFESRKRMLLDKFPSLTVMFIKDIASDAVWSKRLDGQIRDLLSPRETVILYGGRESFLDVYSGVYPTRELMQERWVSGTELRQTAAREIKSSRDFRHGVIWALSNQYPKCYPTVDVAIFNEEGDKILLGRKQHEELYRLVGGFAEPTSPSYEADARREVQEETGLAITDPIFITSRLVPDWRYANEDDQIKTLLFKATAMSGQAKANDDLAEVRWFDVASINIQRDIVPTHHDLMQVVLDDHKEN